MNKIEDSFNKNLPSIIIDPFKKDKIKAINLFWRDDYFQKGWSGSIEFKNGNTTGKQDLVPTEDFKNLMDQLKTIISSL